MTSQPQEPVPGLHPLRFRASYAPGPGGFLLQFSVAPLLATLPRLSHDEVRHLIQMLGTVLALATEDPDEYHEAGWQA